MRMPVMVDVDNDKRKDKDARGKEIERLFNIGVEKTSPAHPYWLSS